MIEVQGIAQVIRRCPWRGVIQREPHRGQRLAAARWHGQDEQARRHSDPGRTWPGCPCANGSDRWVGSLPCVGQRPREGRAGCRQGGPGAVVLPSLTLVLERLGILEIRIRQTGKHHPSDNRQVKAGPIPRTDLGQHFVHQRAEVHLDRSGDCRRDGIALAETLDPAAAGGVRSCGVRQARMVAQDGLGSGPWPGPAAGWPRRPNDRRRSCRPAGAAGRPGRICRNRETVRPCARSGRPAGVAVTAAASVV